MNGLTSLIRKACLAYLISCFGGVAFAAQVAVQIEGDNCRLSWEGDERLELSFSRTRGLLNSAVNLRVDNHLLTFDGFYVAFNGQRDGYVTTAVDLEVETRAVRATHSLKHASWAFPIRVIIRVALSESDKAIRFEVDSDNGPALHLDRLGIGNHRGSGISPKRMFVTKFFVLEPPIDVF